jgi:hypothetical protein
MDFRNPLANPTRSTAGIGGSRNSQNPASLSSQRKNKAVVLLRLPLLSFESREPIFNYADTRISLWDLRFYCDSVQDVQVGVLKMEATNYT